MMDVVNFQSRQTLPVFSRPGEIYTPMPLLVKQICPLVLSLLLAGCGSIGSMDFPGVYKISIPQGNIITQDMVDQLRPGMTKRQVIFVMGTPLVRDPYHQDRWDYVYNYQPGGGIRGQERITVFFVENELTRISGDFAPDAAADHPESVNSEDENLPIDEIADLDDNV